MEPYRSYTEHAVTTSSRGELSSEAVAAIVFVSFYFAFFIFLMQHARFFARVRRGLVAAEARRRVQNSSVAVCVMIFLAHVLRAVLIIPFDLFYSVTWNTCLVCSCGELDLDNWVGLPVQGITDLTYYDSPGVGVYWWDLNSDLQGEGHTAPPPTYRPWVPGHTRALDLEAQRAEDNTRSDGTRSPPPPYDSLAPFNEAPPAYHSIFTPAVATRG
ncbi:uncharacterized protein E0L32_008150 [Thyridium curvatum]|uniref:Uncharacterized protein n=1 Tax=Thyridium curvatum TaxID=1093900 RepID=A0A507AWY1_9PEZI|nr:uncharacterized protein E0L32_008150 [Thyridium curvatum]TPX10944.1 hypothetical protein E0L32_008150 [Thyridium curvatum]